MKTQSIAPVFHVSSLEESLKFYKKVLNFTEDFRFEEYAGVRYGEVAIHLCAHNLQNRPIGGGSAYIFCDELDVYYGEVRKAGGVVTVPLDDRPYGMRDFTVLDPDGNHLNFGCDIRNAPDPAPLRASSPPPAAPAA